MRDETVGNHRKGALILSSGRCGSTLLSDLLGKHSALTALHEFFISVNRVTDMFLPGPHTGQEFWDLISEPSTALRTLHRLGRMPHEFRYPLRSESSDSGLEISGLLGYTLPGLSENPDVLLRELAHHVTGFPDQEWHSHCDQLFHLLAGLSGKGGWVERSGASAFLSQSLVDGFPDIPVIYLTRNCVDTAISMSRSPIAVLFQLGMLIAEEIGVNPYVSRAVPDARELPSHIASMSPENLTAETLDSFIGHPGTISRAIVYQAMMHHISEAAVSQVPQRLLLRICYEDLLSAPKETLSLIGDFLGLAGTRGWIDSVAHCVRPQPTRLGVGACERAELTELFTTLTADPALLGRGRIDEVMSYARKVEAEADFRFARTNWRAEQKEHTDADVSPE